FAGEAVRGADHVVDLDLETECLEQHRGALAVTVRAHQIRSPARPHRPEHLPGPLHREARRSASVELASELERRVSWATSAMSSASGEAWTAVARVRSTSGEVSTSVPPRSQLTVRMPLV